MKSVKIGLVAAAGIATVGLLLMLVAAPRQPTGAPVGSHSGQVISPAATSITQLVVWSDLIVFAHATQEVQVVESTGYNISGTLEIPHTPTPLGPTWTPSSQGATSTATPEPGDTVAMWDYDLAVTETLLDDGIIAANGIPRLRIVDGGDVETTKIFTTTYLYFLSKNPDSTYGLFAGGCSRFNTSGNVVTCSGNNPSSFYGPAENMTGQEFVDAVKTVIALGTPTPTPTP